MAIFTALYDACVLYPAPLRDLLMWLALTELFRARWTNAIHDEWIENLLKERSDLTRGRLERTRDLMNRAVPDCLVTGYEDMIPALSLPDPDDRHVLAAAIHSEAEIIVTYNLDDFPSQALGPHEIEARHPDQFVTDLLDQNPALICAAVKQHRLSLKNPPKTVEEYLATLGRLRFPGR